MTQIDGVHVHNLRIIRDQRGEVRHMMRDFDEAYSQGNGFGEIYFSIVKPNIVKAWHLHKKMTLRYACVYGAVRIQLYDDRPNSATRGVHNVFYLADFKPLYKLIVIPPRVWNGFKSISATEHAIVANCADMPHDPDEIMRIGVEVPTSTQDHVQAELDEDWRHEVDWGHYEASG